MCNLVLVQSACNVLLVLLTAATLYVLYGYAKDTKAIAKSSSEQMEQAQKPFLTLVEKSGQEWCIANQGFGPALNITYTEPISQSGISSTILRPIRPLEAGGEFRLSHSVIERLQGTTVLIKYDSLSNNRYETKIEWGPETVVRFRLDSQSVRR